MKTVSVFESMTFDFVQHNHQLLQLTSPCAFLSMIHTADCERTFSTQNLIVTKSRIRLAPEILLIAKHFIYMSKLKSILTSFQRFLQLVKYTEKTEHQIALESQKLKSHQKKWKSLLNLNSPLEQVPVIS